MFGKTEKMLVKASHLNFFPNLFNKFIYMKNEKQ